jgi:hypothetical protein
MFSKKYLAAGLLIACSTVAVASTAIGTASARGSILVDGYAISGNATLFDGTAVQTSSAIATVRLNKGTEIRLGTSSQGMLFHDHMILQQGKTEVATSDAFRLEASGFQIVPAESNARAVVAVTGLGKMQVTSVAGAFKVMNASGNVLGKVAAGKALSFAAAGGGGMVSLTGVLSKSHGHYFLTDLSGMHEILGKDADNEIATKGFEKYVGKNVMVDGVIDPNSVPAEGAVNVVDMSSMSQSAPSAKGSGGWSNESKLAIAEGTAAAGFLGWGIYEAASSKTSASR